MPEINIHTVLGFCPRPKKHEILVITRGATASINYDLTAKVYGMSDIDQLTYIFKQGKDMYAYNMVNYFALSRDTSVQLGKTYYTIIPENVDYTQKCTATIVVNPTGSPIANNYYEIVDQAPTESLYWDYDSHFSYEEGTDFSYINFMFNSDETCQFKVTRPDCNMQCEVAVRLNTDNLSGMHKLDSVVIEPQHPIAVVDSLYSHIEN